MQVNSVSLNNPNSKPAFKAAVTREDLENFANLDELTVRKLALAKASHNVDDKKHRRITNAIYWSIPVAAGIAAAVRTPSQVISRVAKTNFSRSARIATFAVEAMKWAGTFLAIDAVFGAKHKLDKKIPSLNEFTNEHPVVSTLATVGASIAAVWGAGKGASKLITKLAKNKLPVKSIKDAIAFNTKLNNNKILNKTSEVLGKVHPAIKSFGKGVLDWSPWLLILASISHSTGHERAKAQEYSNNYQKIKTAQNLVREGLAIQDAADEIAE